MGSLSRQQLASEISQRHSAYPGALLVTESARLLRSNKVSLTGTTVQQNH